MNRVRNWRELSILCPVCQTVLAERGDGLHCSACGRSFPILFDIPDLRIEPDRYLSLEDEREKATRLHAFAQGHCFEDTLAYYYSITDDVSTERAELFKHSIRQGPSRSKQTLSLLAAPDDDSSLLDVGCGAGSMLLESAQTFRICVGLDIALRWLVIAQKRLQEHGEAAVLICANAESRSFPCASFSHVILDNVVDHVRSPTRLVRSSAELVMPGGQMWVSGWNRWWPGPHPAVGRWAAGWRPLKSKGQGPDDAEADPLRNATLVSANQVARAVSEHLLVDSVEPRTPPPPAPHSGFAARAALDIYGKLAKWRLGRYALALAGPAFQILAHKPISRK